MILTEVPPRELIDKAAWWVPYAARIAQREGCEASEYIEEAMRGEARVFVLWGANGKPAGAIATRMLVRADKTRIGELHWCAGDGVLETLSDWLPQLEAILARHGATRIKLTGRHGWTRILKPFGYRRTRVILEKGLENHA